jgi:hypothetical protein
VIRATYQPKMPQYCAKGREMLTVAIISTLALLLNGHTDFVIVMRHENGGESTVNRIST